jgi:hypothetical protein
MFHKFIIFLNLIFFLFSLTVLYAQDEEHEVIIISERVGEVVDLEERNYYQLFLGVEGFQSAEFLKISDSLFLVKIIYQKNDIEQIQFQRLTESKMQHIREFIDHFEEIQIGVYTPIQEMNREKNNLIKIYKKPENLIPGQVTGEVFMGLGSSVFVGLLFGKGGPLYDRDNSDYDEINWGFLVGSTLANTLGVYIIGNLGDQEGTILNTFLGSLIGTIASMGLIVTLDNDMDKNEPFDSTLLLLSQTAGSVITFNMTRKVVAYKSKDSLLSFKDGNWSLCYPPIYLESNPLQTDDWIQKVNLLSVNF